jgi:hypothetical protein
MLKSRKARVLASLVAVTGVLAGFVLVTPAEAERAQCRATPVPGQAGVSIVTCARPIRKPA